MMHTLAPSTLLIGPAARTQEHAHHLLQQALCPQGGCNGCGSCQMIQAHQHHHVLWLAPEKKYTLENLEPITHTIEFALEPNEHFFFVLEKAEFLSIACSNSLLKLVEEPPAGYHFIFLAHQAHLVLPTIRSRSHLFYTDPHDQVAIRPFLRHFMEKSTSAATFLKDLQTEGPEDHEVPGCIDTLLEHWIKRSIESLAENNTQTLTYAQQMITLLQKTMHTLPMPGSSKIFWRNLFLQKP